MAPSQHARLLVQNCARGSDWILRSNHRMFFIISRSLSRREFHQEVCKQSDYIVISERTLIWVLRVHTLKVWSCQSEQELSLRSIICKNLNPFFNNIKRKCVKPELLCFCFQGQIAKVEFQAGSNMMTVKNQVYTSDWSSDDADQNVKGTLLWYFFLFGLSSSTQLS